MLKFPNSRYKNFQRLSISDPYCMSMGNFVMIYVLPSPRDKYQINISTSFDQSV